MHHVRRALVGSLQVDPLKIFGDAVPNGESYVADIWDTNGPPTPHSPDLVARQQEFTIEPPARGLRVRYTTWGPNLDSSHIHATTTLDIDFIISGQVDLLLEDGSITCGPGDFVVLPGVKHGWRAGPEGVTILFIMQQMA
jgi:hypothetical protein